MFYLVLGENNEIVITPCLEKVKEYIVVQLILKPAAPLGILKEISEQLGTKTLSEIFSYKSLFKRLSSKRLDFSDSLINKALSIYPEVEWYWDKVEQISHHKANPVLMSNQINLIREFSERTKNRVLTRLDFKILAQEMKVTLSEVMYAAQTTVELGQGNWIPAIKRVGESWQCMRCGSMEMEEWPSIYGQAATCTGCSVLGALSTLEYLYQSGDNLLQEHCRQAKNVDHTISYYKPSRKATPAQERGSEELIKFMKDPAAAKILLWAACGAGKTEVVFPALDWALQEGLKVLFAAPRQDVIHDIVPRVQKDFPKLKFQLLTGSAPNRFEKGQLVLATTHQVLRFNRGFDLIILDELDAFPYHGNRMLDWGIKKALKPQGKMIYLTATPSKTLRKQAAAGDINVVRIPARHHGQLLPVPEWRKSQGIRQGVVDQGLRDRLAGLIKDGPVLIFVPTVKEVFAWVKIIQDSLPGTAITGSHSQDAKRVKKLERFLRQEYKVFVSTSILERGITIPGVQVIVLEADHFIFDERALVQMAGRVGRTTEFPSGKVLFFSATQNTAINEAIQWIRDQNYIAITQGLIKV